jgi:hypothetical protein
VYRAMIRYEDHLIDDGRQPIELSNDTRINVV